MVSGMKTLGEYVIRVPWCSARMRPAAAMSSSVGVDAVTVIADMRAGFTRSLQKVKGLGGFGGQTGSTEVLNVVGCGHAEAIRLARTGGTGARSDRGPLDPAPDPRAAARQRSFCGAGAHARRYPVEPALRAAAAARGRGDRLPGRRRPRLPADPEGPRPGPGARRPGHLGTAVLRGPALGHGRPRRLRRAGPHPLDLHALRLDGRDHRARPARAGPGRAQRLSGGQPSATGVAPPTTASTIAAAPTIRAPGTRSSSVMPR